ncbi:hypothetical protein [Sphingomonas sp.]|uniref:hypothetical protein n=1 Tax=Sphingomonas sp. TaxID=28214 RepID=UPI003B3BB058
MRMFPSMVRSLCAASALALVAAPALAGKHDRAEQAIAEARGKIDAANKVGTAGEAPHSTAAAEASLKLARESLASGHKEEAIQQAIHASQLADTAIGQTQQNRSAAEQTQRADAADAAAAAQQEAAAANERAATAEQAAAAAAADAQAARSAPPIVVAANTPAPTTTVTTETTKHSSVAPATRTRVRKAPVRTTVRTRPVATETTKTTVTTTAN